MSTPSKIRTFEALLGAAASGEHGHARRAHSPLGGRIGARGWGGASLRSLIRASCPNLVVPRTALYLPHTRPHTTGAQQPPIDCPPARPDNRSGC